MKIYMIIDGEKGLDCRWTELSKKDNGYFKVDRDFLIEFMPSEVFEVLVKRGIYINGKDSEKESGVYIQRLILALYYIIVGLQGHHLLKILAQNYISHLIPIKIGVHQELDREDFLEGIEQSFEFERKEQIKQFADDEERKLKSRNRLQNREETIIRILELSVKGLSVDEIVQVMDGKVCDKKVREYRNLFPLAEEFLGYLEYQKDKEFSGLYSNLGEKWRYVIKWEERKNKNIAEFLASKMGKKFINSNSTFTPEKDKINQESYYGYLSKERDI